MKLTREEHETIINYNAAEHSATVYTRDKTVMRRLDALVIEYPEHYRLIGETDIDKTYEMPKSHVNYRKPKLLNQKRRESLREQMEKINRAQRGL